MIVDKINFRNKIILALLALMIIFITCLSISYAYFSAVAISGEQTITTGNLSLKFNDNIDIIRNDNIYPISRSQILTHATKKTFTITNTSDSDIYSILTLEEMKLPDELRNVDFSWALYEDNIMKTTGTFNISINSSKIYLTNYNLMKKNISKTYDLYIWIEESGMPQNSMQDKIFKAKIIANAIANVGSNNLSFLMKNNNDNNLFDTNTNTLNSDTTYYYRGEVNNNYLSFAGHLWRIIRINEDGTIRIILETDIGSKKYNVSSECNTTNKTGCTTNYNESNLKTVLDKWYSNTIGINTNLDNKVTLGKFCNDTSNTFVDRSSNPTFDCTNIIESKVGMISADEVIYSGVTYNSLNNNTYLNNNTSFYTITSNSNSQVYVWNHNDLTLVNNGNIFDYYMIRPVINLNSNTIVEGGEGTINNPYIVN